MCVSIRSGGCNRRSCNAIRAPTDAPAASRSWTRTDNVDVGDEIEANGDGYKAEYVLCADGPYYLTFDKDYKLTGKEKQD